MTSPNLLFLAIDSLRADAVLGDHIPTPNLDAIARSGANFLQCISTSTTTTPSFSSILTGCYPPKHGVRGLQGYTLSPALETMAETFGRAGYHTYAEVTGPLLPETGILRGFDDARHRQAYRVPFFNWREPLLARLPRLEAPWFMLLHIWEVHRPYRSPPDFTKRYDKRGYEAAVAATDTWLGPLFDALPANTVVAVTGDHGEEYPGSRLERAVNRARREARRRLRVERWAPGLDKKLSRDDLGHGFGLNEPQVRVPLAISGPGVGVRTIPQQVRHVDLLPSFAELCGIEAPQGIDGRSLLPAMRGLPLPDEPAYMEAVGVKLGGEHIVGARTPGWKLLKPSAGPPALYRLDGPKGPDEKHHVLGAHPGPAGELESFIEQIAASEVASTSGMTDAEEAVVEQHLRDLGYL